jgi:hypothetical protein
MTLADQDVPVIAWKEPDGLIPRGTVVVMPGRGALPAVYGRFGRRLAGDAYRVRAVADPAVDAELARASSLASWATPASRPRGCWPDRIRALCSRSCWPDLLFLERIRQDAGPRPIAVWEQLG